VNATIGNRRVGVLARVAVAAVLVVPMLVFPSSTASGGGTLRIDPEVLSGRIAQFFLGETENTAGTVPGGFKFGTNIRLSDEHIPRRLISQTEPAVAASPANPLNLVAGFHDLFPKTQDFVCRFVSTTNGGASCILGGATPLQTSGNFCSDPAIAADANGNFYYAYLDINFGAQRSDVDVAKSTDGDSSFVTFSVAVQGQPSVNFPDKEFIGVDTQPASPFKGNICVSLTDFLNPLKGTATDNGQIKLVVSRDGGATWSAPPSATTPLCRRRSRGAFLWSPRTATCSCSSLISRPGGDPSASCLRSPPMAVSASARPTPWLPTCPAPVGSG
jgi:hypothetical protein